jgi:dimethylhistidine N-methyltransferase
MGSSYTLVRRLQVRAEAEHAELLRTLASEPAAISPKYFYDPLGAALFGAICELDEYYLTRTEAAIFARYRTEIVEALGCRRQLVDLGAGDCAKAASWFKHLQPARYVAVDIAEEGLRCALCTLAGEYAGIECAGIVTDFSEILDVRRDLAAGPATYFYSGSSIGNFLPQAASRFLREVRTHCQPGDNLLIGVDTKKDRARLEAAYNDALGITAAFNLNVLRHVNRLLGADFDPAGFRHVAFYDARQGRIEMHLEARSEQRVRIGGRIRVFAAGERIHTENSYKYTPPEFRAMLTEAGFDGIHTWQDELGDFAVYAARVG